MIELYNQADNDNVTRSKFSFDISEREDSLLVEFMQSEYSDLNKWGKPKVLTDIVVNRFLLPEIYKHISSKDKLKKYITKSFDTDLDIVETIGSMATSKQNLVISLPTLVVPQTLRGIPTSFRRVKDTHLPLIVKINGEDVSSAFIDFGDFEDSAVQTAYQALINGNMPKPTHDIFYIDGVKSLHNELSSEM